MSWSIPVKTQKMEKESHHEPSMNYAKNIYRVASQLEDFEALEIGAAWGLSTLAILEAGAKSLVSVDPNLNAQGQNEAEVNGYKDKFIWNCCRSDVYWQENKNRFDLIYVDGSHLYDDVKNDLYEAWKRLRKNGLLLVDDWDHRHNLSVEDGRAMYGVSLACWEFWRDHYTSVEDVGITGRVLWFEK